MNTQLKTQTMQVQEEIDETDDELYGSDGNFVSAGYYVRTHLRAGGQDPCDTSNPMVQTCTQPNICSLSLCEKC